ncbi:MAG: hypothetical protein AAF687_09235 [Pseudomonadota bacterium]
MLNALLHQINLLGPDWVSFISFILVMALPLIFRKRLRGCAFTSVCIVMVLPAIIASVAGPILIATAISQPPPDYEGALPQRKFVGEIQNSNAQSSTRYRFVTLSGGTDYGIFAEPECRDSAEYNERKNALDCTTGTFAIYSIRAAELDLCKRAPMPSKLSEVMSSRDEVFYISAQVYSENRIPALPVVQRVGSLEYYGTCIKYQRVSQLPDGLFITGQYFRQEVDRGIVTDIRHIGFMPYAGFNKFEGSIDDPRVVPFRICYRRSAVYLERLTASAIDINSNGSERCLFNNLREYTMGGL